MRGHIISFTSAQYKAQEEALKDIESNLEHLEQTLKPHQQQFLATKASMFWIDGLLGSESSIE